MGDDNNEQWVFYKDRPEWRDVTPVPQDDGDHPVVAIAYSDQFKDVYDYFRAVLQSKEKSDRALELTKDAVRLNPANYTAWQYRRDILKHLDKDLHEELNYIEEVIQDNPKNYQVWHHRRVIVEWMNDGSKELALTELILAMDAKNYHAWQHRQWALKTFKLFEEELNYVDQLLADDIRNNSAWNQRYFVLNNTTGFTEEVITREIKYTLDKIKIAKENESAWNYLRGMILHDKGDLSQNAIVTDFCDNLYASGNRSPFLLAVLVDMCDEQIGKGSSDFRFTLNRAKELCHALATEYDKIREKYWQHMAETIQAKADGSGKTATDSTCQA